MQQWQVSPVPEYIYSGTQANQPPNDMHSQYASDMSRRQEQPHFPYGGAPQQHPTAPQHQAGVQHPPMTMPQTPQQPQQTQQPQPQQSPHSVPPAHQQHPQHHQPAHQPPHAQAHAQQPQQPPPSQQQQPQPPHAARPHGTPQSTPQPASRGRKRAAPPTPVVPTAAPPATTTAAVTPAVPTTAIAAPGAVAPIVAGTPAPAIPAVKDETVVPPPPKKSRTNTPWTPAEEQRLKHMRDAGNSWAEIAKTFPNRTEGSVKKHWYKDMHYAEFAEDESQALMNAIKEYENNKWKVIGQKVGKPAKACEQYAKEHFPDLFQSPKSRS